MSLLRPLRFCLCALLLGALIGARAQAAQGSPAEKALQNGFFSALKVAACRFETDSPEMQTFLDGWFDCVASTPGQRSTALCEAIQSVALDCLSQARSPLPALLERHFARSPDSATLANKLAWTLLIAHNDPARALDITRGVALDTALLDTRAWALFRLGRTEDALQLILDALEAARDDFDPAARHPLLFDHAGDILYKAQRPREALRAWNQAHRVATLYTAHRTRGFRSAEDYFLVSGYDDTANRRKAAALRLLLRREPNALEP